MHSNGVADTKVVLNMRDARGHLREILGAMLEATAGDRPRQEDLASLHLHLDVRGIDEAVLRQALADILVDALVRTLVALGATAPVRT